MSGRRSMDHQDEEEEELFIRVTAPATLEEGYSFDVLVSGEPFTVHVPPGGVKEGDEFDVLYDRAPRYLRESHGRANYHHDEQEEEAGYGNNEAEEEDEDETHLSKDGNTLIAGKDEDDTYLTKDGDTLPARTLTLSDEEEVAGEDDKTIKTWFDEETGAPIGRWRTKLCSCWDVITQSTFWMACCCTPVLIAQLIHRFHLTWTGLVGDVADTQLSYNRIVIGFLVALGFWKVPGLGDLIMTSYWVFVVVYIGTQVRAHMRQKYKIPTTLPTRCLKRHEDCCCMTFCGCCATIQMARHTHDDKEYPGHGCTTTGLGFDAPPIMADV
ncbi:unnamed protein product [Cylindrotheca closterium]|uniref:Uncharacterized protein n=1 Tax=Cylindrotheca closterium TaxID=2856 RepID=A0AAD2CLD9_9STRA|nr:unnamed protein product [Cylindrotheca closterium]